MGLGARGGGARDGGAERKPVTTATAGGGGDYSFRIVLNYRREDTSGHAGRLYDALAERFGDDHVFMDIDKIDPGEDFAHAIARAIDASDVFLALIGREWLTVTDSRGRRRLESPEDFVRMEIETALARDVRVIPILVQGAEMPSSEELPASLASLVRRNAVELRDTSWRSDVDRLADALAKTREREEEDARRSRLPVIVAGAVLLGAAAILGIFFSLRDGDTTPDRAPESVPEEQSPAIAPGTIAYKRGDDGVFMMDSDGSGVTPLPGTSGGDGDPDWSADGTKVAIARDNNIRIVPLNPAEAATAVTNSGEYEDGQPAWSPGDRALAFERRSNEPGARQGIWVVDLAGDSAVGVPRDLTRVARQTGVAPDWSPDGRLIAFMSSSDVWVMRNDGTQAEPLTDDIAGANLFPAWAPSGRRIAFVETGADACKISIIDLDAGRSVRTVSEGKPDRCRDLAWSPDGKQIAFADPTGIWVVDAEGGEPTRVAEGERLSRTAWGRLP